MPYHYNSRSGRRRMTRKSVAKAVSNVKFRRRVSQAIDRSKELKSVIKSGITLSPSTSWTYYSQAMDTGEGDTTTSRDGFDIKGMKLKVKFDMTNADATNIVRIVVFRNDRNDTPVGMPANTRGFFDDLFYQNHKLVYDRRFFLRSPYSGGSDVQGGTAIINLKHLVKYNTGGSSSPHVGNYWIGAISDSGAASHPSVLMTTRFSYVEA